MLQAILKLFIAYSQVIIIHYSHSLSGHSIFCVVFEQFHIKHLYLHVQKPSNCQKQSEKQLYKTVYWFLLAIA